jgi:uncharacterized membrane protein
MHAWHPLLVHFPLGLLLGGAAVEAAGWLTRRPSLRRAGLVLLTAGVLLALPAVATGLLAYNRVDHSDEAHALMELHRNLMLIAVGLFAFAVAWRWRAGERVTTTPSRALLYAFLLATASAVLVVGADRGADLVFGHATGLPSARLDEVLRERGVTHGHPAASPGEGAGETTSGRDEPHGRPQRAEGAPPAHGDSTPDPARQSPEIPPHTH